MATTTQPVLTRATSRPLHLWHLLSLDAPTVATLWTCFIARSIHLRLPLLTPVSMFLAVWLLYAADRLLDARPFISDPLHPSLEARHRFHHLHRTAFLSAIVLTSISLAALLPRIPREALHLYLILGTLLAGYFILIHATPAAPRLPKELAVGLFFAAATFIPTVARVPSLRLQLLPSALLLAILCSLNCLFIYAWEHEPRRHVSAASPPHLATLLALRYLRRITFTLTLAAVVLSLLRLHTQPPAHTPWQIDSAIATAAAFLLLLDHSRRTLHATTLRAAADLVLLTPLLFLPFLHT